MIAKPLQLRRNCDNEGTCRSRTPGNGSGKSSPATSLTTPCRRIARRSAHSAITSPCSGTGLSAGAVRGHSWCGRGWRRWPTRFFPGRGSFILGPVCALPSNTRGRSRMRESRTCGSARVAPCKRVELSCLRWQPRQSLASSRVPSLAWCPATATAKRRQGGCRPECQ